MDFPSEILSSFQVKISRVTDSQISTGGSTAAAGQTLRSQPDPSPNAPMDQLRDKKPGALAATNIFYYVYTVFTFLQSLGLERLRNSLEACGFVLVLL